MLYGDTVVPSLRAQNPRYFFGPAALWAEGHEMPGVLLWERALVGGGNMFVKGERGSTCSLRGLFPLYAFLSFVAFFGGDGFF